MTKYHKISYLQLPSEDEILKNRVLLMVALWVKVVTSRHELSLAWSFCGAGCWLYERVSCEDENSGGQSLL